MNVGPVAGPWHLKPGREVDTGSGKQWSSKRQAETAATQQDPIINNERGLTQMELEAMMRAKVEIEAREGEISWTSESSSLNQALCKAATDLPDARKDQTDNSSEGSKRKHRKVKKPDAAQIQEAM